MLSPLFTKGTNSHTYEYVLGQRKHLNKNMMMKSKHSMPNQNPILVR